MKCFFRTDNAQPNIEMSQKLTMRIECQGKRADTVQRSDAASANAPFLLSLLLAFMGATLPVFAGCSRTEDPGLAGDFVEAVSSMGGEVQAADNIVRPTAPVDEFDLQLQEDLRKIVNSAIADAGQRSKGRVRPSDVRVALHVRERGSGRVRAALGDRQALMPASGLKLVTTAAALVLLGPKWEFVTPMEALGPIVEGRLEGDLVLRAAGDPLYAADGTGRMEGRLSELSQALIRSGVRSVSGQLILDEGSFPDPGPGPGWPDSKQHWQDYCAFAAGFSANAGMLVASVKPTKVGALAAIEVHPEPHGLPRRYDTKTVSGSINDVRIGATPYAASVRGSIGSKLSIVEASFAHPDPVQMFGSVLMGEFERAGIDIAGGLARQRGAAQGDWLGSMRTPLADMLIPINAHSVNSVADHVFFATGLAVEKQATREAGRNATARALERLGVSDQDLIQVDGSGLSRDNRISPRQMSALIDGVLSLESAGSQAWLESLAVAGTSGTLEKRMRDSPARGRVFGKTGWIEGASSLSGLARSVDGREYVFSILVSYPRKESGLNTYVWKPMHDAIATRIVSGAKVR